MGKKILIVDDEKSIVDILVYNLEKEGYETIQANDGEEAIKKTYNEKPDLILLDVMLPKLDGFAVCKTIRQTMNTPILMLTAKEDVVDKIVGLELGADDYITKPFSVRELMARIKANFRKINPESNLPEQSIQQQEPETNKKSEKRNIMNFPNITLDLDRYETKVKNQIVDLTLREFELLKFLANEEGQVFSREYLLEKVWGYEYFGDVRTVDVTIRRIREKIEEDPSNPKILVTKRGIGYYFSGSSNSQNEE